MNAWPRKIFSCIFDPATKMSIAFLKIVSFQKWSFSNGQVPVKKHQKWVQLVFLDMNCIDHFSCSNLLFQTQLVTKYHNSSMTWLSKITITLRKQLKTHEQTPRMPPRLWSRSPWAKNWYILLKLLKLITIFLKNKENLFILMISKTAKILLWQTGPQSQSPVLKY